MTSAQMTRTEKDRRDASRGGGSHRCGGRGPQSREVQVSKKLSWLLRHGAEKEGLTIGHGGYLNLAEVLNNRHIRSLNPRPTLSEVQEIVRSNEKQRFSLILNDATENNSAIDNTDGNAGNYKIRANQGHSIAVDESGLLQPINIENQNLPKVVVHGTRTELWPSILNSGGLKPMTRNHVHFATGVPSILQNTFGLADDAERVETQGMSELGSKDVVPEITSGMRASSTLLIFIDLKTALEDGVVFWLSDNGVVLSEGQQGLVQTKYFSLVLSRDGRTIMRSGVVV